MDLEGRWYAPLGTMGGGGQLGAGVQFVLGLTAKSGFVFGDAGPFFTELYSLGGVQYGIPLRGYDEFSITPNGFDPSAERQPGAAPDAFGKSYAAFTVEAGARISQSLYVDAFFDAGNVYRSARQWDPTRLFRGAGFGAAVISPLGPIGVDLGYGFDKVDAPGRPDPGLAAALQAGQLLLVGTHLSSGAKHEAVRRGSLGRPARPRLWRRAARRRSRRGGAKLAYVNTQAILKSTPGYAQAESTFTKELETYRGEVQKLQASLDSAASDFEQQIGHAEPDPAGGQAQGSRGPAAEARAAHPGAAAAGRDPGARAARPDPDQGQQRDRRRSGRRATTP